MSTETKVTFDQLFDLLQKKYQTKKKRTQDPLNSCTNHLRPWFSANCPDLDAFVANHTKYWNTYTSAKSDLRSLPHHRRYLVEALQLAFDHRWTSKRFTKRDFHLDEEPKPLGRFLDEEEIRKILTVLEAESPKTRLQVLLSLRMGLKLSQILKLEKDQVDLEGGKIHLTSGPHKQKNPDGSIDIHPTVIDELTKYFERATGKYVFPMDRSPNEPQADLRYWWSNARTKSGVDCRFEDLCFTFHQNKERVRNSRTFGALRPGTTSSILWHFTGGPRWNQKLGCQETSLKPESESYAALEAILKSKTLRVGNYHELIKVVIPEVKTFSQSSKRIIIDRNKRIEIQTSRVCCLADIPMAHLRYHASRYGRFAIGFRRQSAIDATFNPVFYTLEKHQALLNHYQAYGSVNNLYLDRLADELDYIESNVTELNASNEISNEDIKNVAKDLRSAHQDVETAQKSLSDVLALVKTFGQDQFDTIYAEREWRSLSEFKFKHEDVAFVVLPKAGGYYNKFVNAVSHDKSFSRYIPIVPWEDLLEH